MSYAKPTATQRKIVAENKRKQKQKERKKKERKKKKEIIFISTEYIIDIKWLLLIR